jgi:tetratricopeptide (TPR) repeat protein
VRDAIRRGWDGLREVERFRDAEVAYRTGEAEAAALAYEALLVGGPAIALRDDAERHLREALYAWAEADLRGGEPERALDRYRWVRDAFRDPEAGQAIAELYLAWGDRLRDEGDHRAAIAAYGRIAGDVPAPRWWVVADERRVETYCAWQEALRASGDVQGATLACAELLTVYPDAGEMCCAQ